MSRWLRLLRRGEGTAFRECEPEALTATAQTVTVVGAAPADGTARTQHEGNERTIRCKGEWLRAF